MPALNFAPEFAKAVESGEKMQTIRAMRKRPFRVGDTLYLYTGMMHPGCRKLGEAICTRAQSIAISLDGISVAEDGGHFLELIPAQCEAMATADGFSEFAEMLTWFAAEAGLPFAGQIIDWKEIHT